MRADLKSFWVDLRTAIIVLIIMVAIVLVVIGVAVVLLDPQERQNIEKKFGAEIPAMCENMDREREVSNYTLSNPWDFSLLKFVILTNTGRYHNWHDDLPSYHQAENKDDLELVICVDETPRLIEECVYSPSNPLAADYTVERQQHAAYVVVLDPKTNTLVGEFSLTGGMPGECPDIAVVRQYAPIYGDDIPYWQFYGRLMSLFVQ